MDLLIDRLPDAVEHAVRGLLEKACSRSLTLATAESCTGGLLAAMLTDVEGCSHVFERGFVVYSNEAKAGMLGMDRQLIEREGPVSRAVALAMAKGALEHSSADVVLAVTGFAGPAEPADEPGLVHLACMRRGRQPAHREIHLGNRGRSVIRAEAARIGFVMMTAQLD